MAERTARDHKQMRDRSGKYLSFMLGDEYYGLKIDNVGEIVAVMHITPVPQTDSHMLGVVNIRGHLVPVMDLRSKLDLPARQSDASTCIIVVDVGDIQVGMIVDKLCEVTDILGTDIEDAPLLSTEVDTSFLLGIGKTDGRVINLLDVDMILTGNEAEMLEKDSVEADVK
jgi:purine-binding chemotaxis protein CheW